MIYDHINLKKIFAKTFILRSKKIKKIVILYFMKYYFKQLLFLKHKHFITCVQQQSVLIKL